VIHQLSILIPCFNCSVVKLVNKLHQQAFEQNIDFEIIVREDGEHSFLAENAAIENLTNVLHLKESNIGRSAGRNRLAQLARFDWLLFLDADSELVSSDYIKFWCENAEANKLISGGRIYDALPPKDFSYYLHWLWGTHRELTNTEIRNQAPENNFLSNNFLIEKKIALQFPFNENLVGYGYEDALFAFQLTENGIGVVHHFNPVKHIGLDKTEQLLKKMDEAMLNLLRIEKQFSDNKKKSPLRSKLLTVFKVLRFVFPMGLSTQLRNHYKKKLMGSNPTLSQFDLYRLFTLLYFHQQNRTLS
jgi:glycosyltransferase involved in cell wall biosynthesis